MVKCWNTLHLILLLKVVCKSLQQILRIIMHKGLRQCNNQFPCLNTFSIWPTLNKAFLITLCQFPLKISLGNCCISRIQILLLCLAWYISNPAWNICKLVHLYKWISRHTNHLPSNANVSGHIGVRLRTHRRFRRNSSMQSRNTQSTKRSFVRWVYFALKRRGLVKNLSSVQKEKSHISSQRHMASIRIITVFNWLHIVPFPAPLFFF